MNEKEILKQIDVLQQKLKEIKVKNNNRSHAKMEFTLVKQDIIELYRNGYIQSKVIHAKLLEQKLITMKYSSFNVYFKKLKSTLENNDLRSNDKETKKSNIVSQEKREEEPTWLNLGKKSKRIFNPLEGKDVEKSRIIK